LDIVEDHIVGEFLREELVVVNEIFVEIKELCLDGAVISIDERIDFRAWHVIDTSWRHVDYAVTQL